MARKRGSALWFEVAKQRRDVSVLWQRPANLQDTAVLLDGRAGGKPRGG